MSQVTSSLSAEQQKKLLCLLGHVRLHLLYKATVHGFTGESFHNYCDYQGPTVIVAYNTAGFVFGAYTSQDHNKEDEKVKDTEAFLYSIPPNQDKPLKVAGISGQCAFTNGVAGPNFGALVFLDGDKPKIVSNPGIRFQFEEEAMHGNYLALTELEVYRAEALGPQLLKPWRNMQWTAQRWQTLKEAIMTFKPDRHIVQQARVLLVGPVGAGKSSFFNSINSAFNGYMTCQAIAGTADRSVTNQFRTYTIRPENGGRVLPLVLCDTMGLEETADTGLDMDDLINIYQGHVKDGYQFSPAAPIMLGSPMFRQRATIANRIHCVAFVIDACQASLSQKMVDKFLAIRKKTNQMGLPQIVLLTKVDKACPLVAEDIKNVYYSVHIQKTARELSECLRIPLYCILPVKNHHDLLELDQDTDILLFSAVQQMLNFADNFFEN
ncbi:interferon-induced protein 44-like isoform X3 [Nelusetta ayraudi]|uniref:interferon-induced protein 44-like isoform X3 n=1 Tax=Nelusetta ayraudi TaxID=303726 RepID=UPI003F71FA75